MKEITLENLVPSELLIFKTGELDETVDTSVITEYVYTLENGIYLFDNEGTKTVSFYLDDETKCKIYKNLCKDSNLYYYYVSLTLGEACPEEYTKLVDIYNRFIKLIDNDCDCK